MTTILNKLARSPTTRIVIVSTSKLPLITTTSKSNSGIKTTNIIRNNSTSSPSASSSTSSSSTSTNSTLKPNYPGHIRINLFQNTLLAIGSAITSLLDPSRHGTSFPIPPLLLLPYSYLNTCNRYDSSPIRNNSRTIPSSIKE